MAEYIAGMTSGGFVSRTPEGRAALKDYGPVTAPGNSGLEATRQTILRDIAEAILASNGRLCMAQQKIDGIMRRAGLSFSPSAAAGSGAGIIAAETDIQSIENALTGLNVLVAEIEALADSLAALA